MHMTSTTERLLDRAEQVVLKCDRNYALSGAEFLRHVLQELSEEPAGAALSPSNLFRQAMTARREQDDSQYPFSIVGVPLRPPQTPLRAGDWMVRWIPGAGDIGHVSILTSGDLLNPAALSAGGVASECGHRGWYGIVIEAGANAHTRSRPFARRLLDSHGRVLPHTLFLRASLSEARSARDESLYDRDSSVGLAEDSPTPAKPQSPGTQTPTPPAAGPLDLDPPESDADNDIVLVISTIEKPGDVAQYWHDNVKPNPSHWAYPLSDLEQNYIDAMTDSGVAEVLRMRALVDPLKLTVDDAEEAKRIFGSGQDDAVHYANFENRRRIMAHYVTTHPATVRLELGLYRLIRDINPLHFALERGWQIGGGKEMFTGLEVSRLGAAFEFVASLALVYGIGKLLEVSGATAPRTAPRALTDPIYDLPEEGGGMRISGRWYTEHALERMAPDTPQVRAEIRARVVARLERIGIKIDNPAFKKILDKALEKIDPRGVPPSVVESEIAKRGSTNMRVITARRGQVVVTVIPRKLVKVKPSVTESEEDWVADVGETSGNSGSSSAAGQVSAPPAAVANWPLGVDIFQGNTLAAATFKRLKQLGKIFVICKSSQGKAIDKKFAEYYAATASAGMIRGSYHFLANKNGSGQDWNRGTIEEQAATVIAMVPTLRPGDLAPALDLEDEPRSPLNRFPLDQGLFAQDTGYEYRNGHHLNSKAGLRNLLADIQDFMNRIETATGRTPLIYTSRMWSDTDMMNDPKTLSEYPLWTVYHAGASPANPKQIAIGGWGTKWHILQYAEAGKFGWHLNPYAEPGITVAGIDFDAFNGSLYQLRALADLGRVGVAHFGNFVCVAAGEPDGTNTVFVEQVGRTAPMRDGSTSLAAADPALLSDASHFYAYYRGAEDRIVEAISETADPTGRWAAHEISSSGSAALWDPRAVSAGTIRYVVYAGADGEWHLLRSGASGWTITRSMLASAGLTRASAVATGQPTVFVARNIVHVVGRVGAEGHMVDVWNDGHSWHAEDLTDIAMAPVATYSPCVYEDGAGGYSIAYRGLHGVMLLVSRRDNVTTNLTELTASSAGRAERVAGHPTCFVLNGFPHIVYRSTDAKLCEFWKDAGGWHFGNVCADANHAAAADPVAAANNNFAWVGFRGVDGAVHYARYNGTDWICASGPRSGIGGIVGPSESLTEEGAPAVAGTVADVRDSGGPGSRACCALGQWLFPGTPGALDPSGLAGHVYGGGTFGGGPIGYVYTARAGIADLGHIRDLADMTKFIYDSLVAGFTTFKLFEGTAVLNASPANLVDLAAAIAYVESWAHELTTWGTSEDYSAFSPEDLPSNVIGVEVATRAIRLGTPYKSAVDKILSDLMNTELGAQSKGNTELVFAKIQNVWFTKQLTLGVPLSLLRRNFDAVPWPAGAAYDLPAPSWLNSAKFVSQYPSFSYSISGAVDGKSGITLATMPAATAAIRSKFTTANPGKDGP
jgi:GH25 family lysozyme M1 (1,4-beta-N-acetylmuramidase)